MQIILLSYISHCQKHHNPKSLWLLVLTVWPDYILISRNFYDNLFTLTIFASQLVFLILFVVIFGQIDKFGPRKRIEFRLIYWCQHFFGANASENRNALAYCESWGGVFKYNRLKGKTKNNIPQFQKGGVVFWLSGCLDPKKSPKWTLQKIPQCQRIVPIGS